MSFLKHIRIGRKVFGGFGTVLILLLAVTAAGIIGLNSAGDYFTAYREAARQRVAFNRINIEVGAVRIAAKTFIINADDASVAGVHQNIGALEQRIGEAKTLIGDQSALLGRVNEIEKLAQSYRTSFDEVVTKQKEVDTLLHGTLDVVGPEMEQLLAAISETAVTASNAEAAYQAGDVLRSVLLLSPDLSRSRDAAGKIASNSDGAGKSAARGAGQRQARPL